MTTQTRLRAATKALPAFLLAFGLMLGFLLSFGSATAAVASTEAPAAATPEPSGPPAEDMPFAFQGIVKDGTEPLSGVEISVSGNGYEQSATTDEAGRWHIGVPEAGTYAVSIDPATLPAELELRDASFASRDFEVGSTTTRSVLFPLVPAGEGADGGDDGSVSTPSATAGPNVFDQIIRKTMAGLNFGLVLALAAIGITLIFGTTGVNNFAHGEMLTLGGLMYYATTTLWGIPWLLAIPLTLLASAAFGWVHDATIFKPLRKRRVGLVQVLIVTIGLSIALRYFFQFLVGGGTQQLRVPRGTAMQVGPATMMTSDIVSMLVSIAVLIGVGLFLTRTRIGKATRAVSDNASLAAASGINVNRVIRIVWVLAGTLTGLAGILYTYFIGGNIKWDVGFSILLLLFAAVTLGGLGSAFGALVGALIIGLTTEISTFWLPVDLRYAVALVILILVLLVRPQGVLGRKERIG